MGFTPTDERAPASELVGVLTLYSNHPDQGKRIQRLLNLPQRPDEPPRPVSGTCHRPTSDICAQLVERYVAGSTILELATDLGLHRDTVSAALERAGVARRYHERRTVDLERADELHAAGLSISEVAKALGVGRTTLIKARRART